MQTRNGLIIRRVDQERGGFVISLYEPTSEDAPFAVIQRGDEGGWYCPEFPGLSAPQIEYVINSVDTEYASLLLRMKSEERQREEKRKRLDESFTKDWQSVLDNYGKG